MEWNALKIIMFIDNERKSRLFTRLRACLLLDSVTVSLKYNPGLLLLPLVDSLSPNISLDGLFGIYIYVLRRISHVKNGRPCHGLGY
jgi:hypothetical protein